MPPPARWETAARNMWASGEAMVDRTDEGAVPGDDAEGRKEKGRGRRKWLTVRAQEGERVTVLGPYGESGHLRRVKFLLDPVEVSVSQVRGRF